MPAGILLLLAGRLYGLVASRGRSGTYQVAVGVAVAAFLLLVWGNLTVGFIGSEDGPANLLYAGVLAVSSIGAVLAKLQPQGVAKAMLAAALTRFAVPFMALLLKQPEL